MRSKRTAWENRERSEPVSTTESPVTQTADVAVKRASSQLSGVENCPENHSRRVPVAISARNPPTMVFSTLKVL
jgi:hypothetical protein